MKNQLKYLSLFAGQFRLIYQVKELLKRGYGQQQIAGSLKVHPFRVRLASGHARSFTDEELENYAITSGKRFSN